LLGELGELASTEEMANWAHRNLPVKNTLATADAQLVEAGFQAKLAAFGEPGEPGSLANATQSLPEAPVAQLHSDDGISPAAIASKPSYGRGQIVPKTIRLRDKDHRKFVAAQPCLVCGRSPADAHHVRFAQPRAMGRKVSDEFMVPVCRVHHRELHRHGDEAAWWREIKIDPLPIAQRLWRQARSNGTAAATVEDNPRNSEILTNGFSQGPAKTNPDLGGKTQSSASDHTERRTRQ
jgi:hypothetical protein